jgi:exodeoxyribonuclease X
VSEITEVIVSDTETTGFDPAEGAALLEVAAVWAPGASSKGVLAYQSFVEFEGKIPPEAKSVHHIQEASVSPGAPFCNPRQHVIDQLLSFETDSTAWAFHNAEFDLRFLPELTRPVICTYRCAMHLWPDAPSHKNTALMYWLETTPDPRLTAGLESHRALYDTAVTATLLDRLSREHSYDELVELTKKPILKTKVNFGKHKGMQWSEVPRDYAQWCLYKSDMAEKDADLRYTLEVRLGLKEAA